MSLLEAAPCVSSLIDDAEPRAALESHFQYPARLTLCSYRAAEENGETIKVMPTATLLEREDGTRSAKERTRAIIRFAAR